MTDRICGRRRHRCHRPAGAAVVPLVLLILKFSFALVPPRQPRQVPGPRGSARAPVGALSSLRGESSDAEAKGGQALNVWEKVALGFGDGTGATVASASTNANGGYALPTDPSELRDFIQAVTLMRVGVPALMLAASAGISYVPLSLGLSAAIDDAGVFSVVSQDSSQYIQNILTTCGLTFSILVGQTYYFLYQQTESVYVALFDEVTAAKALLEQVTLVSQGREGLNRRILLSIQCYVRDDLKKLQDDPAVLLSARPKDDPLEDIMYLTSIGEPSSIYESVRALRQARAMRLGALQRKLPEIQMILLWSLAAIVLSTFPLLGAGSQAIGGMGILTVQAIYLSVIVFGVGLTMGVINDLRRPAGGAYNVDAVLNVMVSGLEEEVQGRLEGRYRARIADNEAAFELSTVPKDGLWDASDNGGDSDAAVSMAKKGDLDQDRSIDGDADADRDSGRTPWIGRRIVERIKNGRKR